MRHLIDCKIVATALIFILSVAFNRNRTGVLIFVGCCGCPCSCRYVQVSASNVLLVQMRKKEISQKNTKLPKTLTDDVQQCSGGALTVDGVTGHTAVPATVVAVHVGDVDHA